jgi:RNA 2',3'-cyclic 3'-phosphodiesterase
VPQLTLPGFEVLQLGPEHHLFFAVMPDPDTAARLAEMAGRLRSGLPVKASPVDAARLHISLHHLSDFPRAPEVVVARACAVGANIEMAPFDVTFDRIASFNGGAGKQAWVLTGTAGLADLADLQQGLGNALRQARLRVSGRRFTPHLTLLYGAGSLDPPAIEPIAWTVREFVLIHSWHGKGRYDIKGRWPLKASLGPDR